jgi:hypothetical protein
MDSMSSLWAKSLAELKGPQTIESIAQHLEDAGHLTPPPNLAYRWQINRARKILGMVQRYQEREGLAAAELIRLAGETQGVFKFVHDVTKDEAKQVCTAENLRMEAIGPDSKRRKDKIARELRRHVDQFKAIFGEEFETLLEFKVPKPKKGRGQS